MASNERHTCTICQRVFMERRRLTQHLNTHIKPFQCRKCVKSFATKADLIRHGGTHVVGRTRFQCRWHGCSFDTTRKDNLKQHIRRNHSSHIKGPTSTCVEATSDPHRTASETINEVDGIMSKPRTCELMMIAAQSGNISLLERILAEDVAVDIAADDGSTALHCAARAGQVEMVRYIIQQGASINVGNAKKNERRPIHEAIISASVPTVAVLLDSGADIQTNIISSSCVKLTIWHFVARKGSIGIASALLESLDEPARARSAQSLFEIAVKEDAEEMVKWISNDFPACRPSMIKLPRRSSLSLAVSNQNYEIMELLISLWTQSDLRDKIAVVDLAIETAAGENLAKFAERLLLLDILPERQIRYCSALHAAAKQGSITITRLLLAHGGFNINEKFAWYPSSTPLHVAAEHGHKQLVRELLSTESIQPMLKDNQERTPLDVAFFNQHFEICTLLPQYADIGETLAFGHKESENDQTLLDINIKFVTAMMMRHDPVLKPGRWEKIIDESVRTRATRCVEVLLQYDRSDPPRNSTDRSRTKLNALMLCSAARHNRVEILQLVLSQPETYVNIVILVYGKYGTALHRAVRYGSLACAELLLAHEDIDTNVRDEDPRWAHGRTPLELAIYFNNKDMIDLFTEHESQKAQSRPRHNLQNTSLTTTSENHHINTSQTNIQILDDLPHEGQDMLMTYEKTAIELLDTFEDEGTDMYDNQQLLPY